MPTLNDLLQDSQRFTLESLISGNELLYDLLVKQGLSKNQINAVEAAKDLDLNDVVGNAELESRVVEYLGAVILPLQEQVCNSKSRVFDKEEFSRRIRLFATDLIGSDDGSCRKGLHSNVKDVDEDYERRFADATRHEVFGNGVPSVKGFRDYLKRLASKTDTFYDDKKRMARTANFWKARLGVEFYFDGHPCTLAARTSSGPRGGFKVRESGTGTSLYARASFPALQVRKPAKSKT